MDCVFHVTCEKCGHKFQFRINKANRTERNGMLMFLEGFTYAFDSIKEGKGKKTSQREKGA